MHDREIDRNTGSPGDEGVTSTDNPRGEVGSRWVADGPVVVRKPGNAGGAKGPWFRTNARRSRRAERLVMSLGTLLKVQKLQAALHAKAKGSPSVGLGELAQGVRGEPSLSSRGPIHGRQAASVVAQDAPGAGAGNSTLPGHTPVPQPKRIRRDVCTRDFPWANA